MTSSRSIPRWLVVLAALVLWVGHASAGRKRVVVLEFDGPKAEKFHEDVVKLIKKSHTVVSVDKWNAKAEELDAGKVTEKNVKKIAKKLKIDGVITGKIDKRRDEYIIKLKLRSGTTGEILGASVQTKADGPRLDSKAQRDIRDELIAIIDELESNRAGGDDDDDAPKKLSKKGGDDEDEPKKSGFGRKGGLSADDEDKPKKKKTEVVEDKPKKKTEVVEDKPKKKAVDEEKAVLATKRSRDDDDDERPRRRSKRKAVVDDDDEEGIEDEVELEDGDRDVALSPGRRAVDVAAGFSFTRRNLNFSYASDLGKPPPGYRQAIPVGGAMIDMTFFPMAFSKKEKGIISGLGLNILYDQVLKINSQKRYLDNMQETRIANLDTKESRWLVGGVLRYPLGTAANSIVVGGSLSYGSQQFTVAQMLPNGDPTDIPNVAYSFFQPAVFARLPLIPKITINLDAGLLLMMNTGDIQTSAHYGAATVTGYELELGADYRLKPNIFARVGVRYQTISFSFKGDPTSMTNTRDTDPDQDVTGAKDVYFGGFTTIGFIY
jgi:hypothetical protein